MEVTIPGMPGILPWYLTSYVAVGGCVGTAVPTPVAFAPQWPWLSVLFYIGAVGSRMGCGDASLIRMLVMSVIRQADGERVATPATADTIR